MTAKVFHNWQQTRQEITLQEFAKKFPDIYEDWGIEEAPPERIFVYRGGYWIFESEPNVFRVHIERDEYNEDYLEVAEMRLFLWAYDENCLPWKRNLFAFFSWGIILGLQMLLLVRKGDSRNCFTILR